MNSQDYGSKEGVSGRDTDVDIKVCIATPTTGIVHATYTMSLLKLVLHFLQIPVLGFENGKRSVITQMQVGANIAANRDNMVDKAIKENCTHLLFIDDDMGFSPECLNIMLARKMHILAANYRRKIPPGYFTCVAPDKSEIITSADSTSLTECWFGGFGFCLIEIDVLKLVKKPRFLMQYFHETDSYTTEDYPFFTSIHELGIPVYVDQEVSKRVWHCGNFNYGFDQAIPVEWSIPYPERKKK